MVWFLWILGIATIFILMCKRASIAVASVGIGTTLLLVTCLSNLPGWLLFLAWVIFGLSATVFNIPKLRLQLVTRHLLTYYLRVQPTMSATEKAAIGAGTVDWDAQLFSGAPNWDKLLAYPAPHLTAEELAFLDGPVEQLCAMLDDWDITHNRADLPPQVWQFMKEQGFFGLIIPKEYGGKQFSAYAHSCVVVKLASVSATASTTVSVPNSLGPAELLMHYGTDLQKKHYLPRLARGEEVPCFALTSPTAGSDAAAITDHGIVSKAIWEGQETLGIRLTWDKRYITLAPVATVLGLAFRLYDPEHLLGDKKDIGITCALIPVTTRGVKIGRRHFPLNTPFQNGPTQGENVFIPLDWIIGGVEMAGQGWRMLMECLAAGRAISLPSISIGATKSAAAATGAYARIRQQFRTPIGSFEGVQEALGRIAGFTYMMDAAEALTTSLIDMGQKPSVLSAIIKYHCTELGRCIANDAMDIQGGKGICLGPKNNLGRGYQSVPISITVEGANILTRSMIIFGQGAVRCHPYALMEMEAANLEDKKQALQQFDKAIFGHMGFTLSNWARAFIHGVTRGRFLKAPPLLTHRYFQKFSHFSVIFALLADMSMVVVGSALKRREMLSARLGDMLSYLYLGSAILKRFDDQGRAYADLPLVRWCSEYLLFQIQQQIDGLLQNFPNRWIAGLLRLFIFPLGRHCAPPADKLQQQVAMILQMPSETRDRLIAGAYLTDDGTHAVGHMQTVLAQLKELEPLMRILTHARHDKHIQAGSWSDQAIQAQGLDLLSEEEVKSILLFEQEVQKIVAVDDFAADELARVMTLTDTEGNMVSALIK